MKRLILILVAAIALGATQGYALDPKEILGKLKGDTTATENQSTGSSSGILGAIGGMIGNTLASSSFSIDQLVGSWSYTSPAVSFQTDNALKKIGGAGAATAVEAKLSPYYKRLGFDKSSLTVDADHNFILKLGAITLKGNVEKDEQEMLVFNFSAFGKVNLGKVKAHATKAGSTLNLTFDATKMIALLTKVASALNNSSLNALSSLLNSYDGIYMGFKFKAVR